MVKLDSLKIGDFFKRTPTAHKVYKRGHFDRASKRYSCLDTNDHCREIFLSGKTQVHIEFEF